MKKKTFWITAVIVIVILVALVVWQTMQINAVTASANVLSSPTQVATSAVKTSSGMVGGC